MELPVGPDPLKLNVGRVNYSPDCLAVLLPRLLGDGLGGGVEEAEAHLQQTLLLPGEGKLEEGVECGGEAEDEGGGGVEPGQLGHEQQHLVVQVVLQVLAHNLNKEEIVIHCCSFSVSVWRVELETKVKRRFANISQSRKRLSHLRHY